MTDTGVDSAFDEDLSDTLTAGSPTVWKLVSVVAGLAGSQVGRRGLVTVWRAVKKDDPPLNPLSRDTTWAEALAFAVVSGAVYGVTRMVAQRGVAGVWTRQLGAPPPGLEDQS